MRDSDTVHTSQRTLRNAAVTDAQGSVSFGNDSI